MNKVILIGNLGRAPEPIELRSGGSACRLSVATTRRWKTPEGEHKEETEWHRVTVFGRQAEACLAYLSTGRQVAVEGRIRTSSYEDAGVKKYSTEVIAEHVTFLGAHSHGK